MQGVFKESRRSVERLTNEFGAHERWISALTHRFGAEGKRIAEALRGL